MEFQTKVQEEHVHLIWPISAYISAFDSSSSIPPTPLSWSFTTKTSQGNLTFFLQLKSFNMDSK